MKGLTLQSPESPVLTSHEHLQSVVCFSASLILVSIWFEPIALSNTSLVGWSCYVILMQLYEFKIQKGKGKTGKTVTSQHMTLFAHGMA